MSAIRPTSVLDSARRRAPWLAAGLAVLLVAVGLPARAHASVHQAGAGDCATCQWSRCTPAVLAAPPPSLAPAVVEARIAIPRSAEPRCTVRPRPRPRGPPAS